MERPSTMNDSKNTRTQFESTILELLKSMEIGEVYRESYRGWTFTVGKTFAVAVEYYYASLPQPGLLSETAATLSRAAKRHSLHPVLLLSCELTERQRNDLEERFDLTLMDRTDLVITASRFKPLLAELEAMGMTQLHKGHPGNSPRLVSPVARP